MFPKEKVLFYERGYGKIISLHKQHTEMIAKDAFYLPVKTHPPYWHPSGSFQYVCVAANEALRFSCVVSFGLRTFIWEVAI